MNDGDKRTTESAEWKLNNNQIKDPQIHEKEKLNNPHCECK